MDVKEYRILGEDIGKHWYYRAKSAAVAQFLRGVHFSKILDVGAGSAFFSRYLLKHFEAYSAWCVDTGYDVEYEETYKDKPLYFRRSITDSDADLVLMMDVLEHVDDDIGLIREYTDKVAEGTKFLISVPAFQFLWSGHDVFLEHRRRYTLRQMEAVIREAGLTNLKGSYYFGLVFPLAAVTRLMQRLKPDETPTSQLKRHSKIVNQILTAACALEMPLLEVNRLCGLTVFCLAKK